MIIEVRKNIHVPIYGGWIDIVISNEEDVYESSKRHFKTDDKSLKTTDAVVLSRNTRIYPVLFSKFITPGIIAHEAKHVVNRLYKDIGIELDIVNDEHEAYLLSWLVNRIWEVKTKYEKLLNEESNRVSKQ